MVRKILGLVPSETALILTEQERKSLHRHAHIRETQRVVGED